MCQVVTETGAGLMWQADKAAVTGTYESRRKKGVGEPDAGKLARPVLRRRGGGNTTPLPDLPVTIVGSKELGDIQLQPERR